MSEENVEVALETFSRFNLSALGSPESAATSISSI